MWYAGNIRSPLIEGVEVSVRGQTFTIAPFNIRRMRRTAAARAIMKKVFAGEMDMDSDEAIQAATQVVATALSANYPDVTAEMLDELEGVSIKDLTPVLEALGRANNQGAPPAGEAAGPEKATGPTRLTRVPSTGTD